MKILKSLGLTWEQGKLEILDQTLLPHEERWLEVKRPDEMVAIIQRLAVRGAPLIGIAAAMALARYALDGADQKQLRQAAARLRAARPTAVNLMWAVDSMLAAGFSAEQQVACAEGLFEQELRMSAQLAEHGSALVQDGEQLLTHCNTGGLATVGLGTALGVIKHAHGQGKTLHVWVDETRPLLQGARLTAWELDKEGVPYTLICDNMAAMLMAQGRIDRVLVGADRIAANGDFANKIGTYVVAVAARHHGIPFHVVAPQSTIDESCPTGLDIPIEQREAGEVRAGRSPARAPVYNPAFDVTPAELVTSTILDCGVREPTCNN